MIGFVSHIGQVVIEFVLHIGQVVRGFILHTGQVVGEQWETLTPGKDRMSSDTTKDRDGGGF